jgi:hypothetical protein
LLVAEALGKKKKRRRKKENAPAQFHIENCWWDLRLEI